MRPLRLYAVSLLLALHHTAALPSPPKETPGARVISSHPSTHEADPSPLHPSPGQGSGQDQSNTDPPSDGAPSPGGDTLQGRDLEAPEGSDSQEPRGDAPEAGEGHTDVGRPSQEPRGDAPEAGEGHTDVGRPSQEPRGDAPEAGEGHTDVGRPRAIVNVRQRLSGEASYIIQPDNQPPPTYQPLRHLPPPTRPVALWRPDIFMKICCSESKLDANEEGSGDASEDAVTSHASEEKDEEEEATDQPPSRPDDGDEHSGGEGTATTVVPGGSSESPSVQQSTPSALENTVAAMNSSEARPEAAGNHTPRYEDASSSPYQDVANFLRDIANSDGFQNVFLGDLISNFGSLDQNAMKLIYSLLIRPLEDSFKEDRMGTVEDDPPRDSVAPENTVVLTRDRLPLRDRPEDGFQPLKTAFLQSRPSEGSSFPIRPSLPVRPSRPTDEMWRPGRIHDRKQTINRRGEERMDVITAPPTKPFEVVLGSSLSHDGKDQRKGGGGGGGGGGGLRPPGPAKQASHPPLPFDKLTLGLEMPPPEALEALPPGSILIPPSHIFGRPNLPKVLPSRGGGAPTLEMPRPDFFPNMPFRTKLARPRPPAQPKLQDIPPRLPGFLPSRQAMGLNPMPLRPPSSPVMQPPRREDAGLHFPFTRTPKGPPPIVNKMSPPVVPTLPAPHRPFRRPPYMPSPTLLSPYLTPPPPPPASPLPPKPPLTTPKHKKEQDHAHARRPVDLNSFGALEESVVREHSRSPDYVSDRNEDYRGRPEVMGPEGHRRHDPEAHRRHPAHTDYYSEVHPDYLDSYYDFAYDEYYHDDSKSSAKQVPPSGDSGHREHRPFIHEASATFHAAARPRSTSPAPPRTTTPAARNDHPTGSEQSKKPRPAETVDPPVHYPSLDDLLGVVKPNFSVSAATKPASHDVHALLQNHRPGEDSGAEAATPAKVNKNPTPRQPQFAADNTVLASEAVGVTEPHQVTQDGWPPGGGGEVLAPSQDSQREHDASVAHIWKNLQLIPLTPDLFATPELPQVRDDVNLTSLFDAAVPLSPDAAVPFSPDAAVPLSPDAAVPLSPDAAVPLSPDAAVPLSPDAALDLAPDLSADVNRISVDHRGVRVTVREEVTEDPEKAEAKFMAYVLIGACCGLALLSITGVIVIVRFKKTCGSRQIKTRTRLTDQGSVENISRHVNQLTPAEDSGHKLGSWFTGRNEHIGSGKLRGNMALPTVHDHKREKKGHSSSTRDLLSISSQSSPAASPRQERRDSEAEEPRASWLHREYRASEDELSQAPPPDPHYRPQHHQARGSATASSSHRHATDHHAYRADPATETDSPSRVTRERRYTGQSRDGDRTSHNTSRRGSRYMSSLDSEELEARLASHAREYPTDSELDDGTTHYDAESREPSRYFSDSRELDDVVGERRGDRSSMTSQELGEHISRDLKQYQVRQESRAHRHGHPEEMKQSRDSVGLEELSSQEFEGEESQLRRSQSQVSFSRDNVQNEVFLEFDSMLRQQGQYLTSEPPASTLGRDSHFTNDTGLTLSRANTPDSIDLPEGFSRDSRPRRDCDHGPPSLPTTPPRFSPPPAPPRPPKPGHLSQSGTPSPQAGRGRPPSPGHSPPSPPRSIQRPVYWTSEEERLI